MHLKPSKEPFCSVGTCVKEKKMSHKCRICTDVTSDRLLDISDAATCFRTTEVFSLRFEELAERLLSIMDRKNKSPAERLGRELQERFTV